MTEDTRPSATDEALRHIDAGFAVIPIATNGKRPTMDQWAQHPVLKAEMARTFLKNPGTQNYGLVMPPDSERIIVVLDLDNGDGATTPWQDRIRELIKAHGPLPTTKVHKTPSGGRHLFFEWPRSKAPKGDTFLGFTLRVLNGRHQVVGPGSVTKDGVYEDISSDRAAMTIAQMPEAWIEAFNDSKMKSTATIREQVEPRGSLITISDEVEGYELPLAVPAGGRYAAIRDYVASRWNRGLTDEELWAGVRDVLAPHFDVALTETELRDRFDRTIEGISQRLGTRSIDRSAPAPILTVVSSQSATHQPSTSSLIVPITDYLAAIPTTIPWLCEPFSYIGGVTLLSGPPKAGKSSLAANLQLSRETGAPFLGSFPTAVGPTLLVTEEGGVAVRYKTSGLTALEILDRKAALGAKLGFADVVNLIYEWAVAHPEALIFVDTLAIWADLKDENDASAVTKAIGYLTLLAQSGECSVVLVHHSRKGGGDFGEGIRGSGAIFGTVDLSVEMSRTDDETSDDRFLDIAGRVVMPSRMRLSFDRPSLTYSVVDEVMAKNEHVEKLLTGVPVKGAPEGASRDDLRALWGKDPRKNIEHLLNIGRLRQELVKPIGARTSSFRYWAIPPVESIITTGRRKDRVDLTAEALRVFGEDEVIVQDSPAAEA